MNPIGAVDGTVVGWGNNSNGVATPPVGLTNVVEIAAGGFSGSTLAHSLALTADGYVVAWGSNLNGQGNVPAGLTNVVAIAAGKRHSLA